MKKALLLILVVYSMSSAISTFTFPWQIKLTGDTATVTKWKSNNDTVQNWAKKVVDTLNIAVPRSVIFSNHTYTFPWMNIDTIPSADTIKATNITSTKSISGSYAGPLTGNSTGTHTGAVVGTTVSASGGFTGSISGGTVAGSTGTFTSTVNVDSLHSTKGATIGGNVGIGTTSPDEKLHSVASGTQLKLSNSNKGSSVWFLVNEGASAIMDIGTNGNNNSITINGGKTIFKGDGNVGINTTSPTALLHVNGAMKATFCTTTVIGNVTGNLTGNVTGNLTGNVTGNTSGSSGSCTGNAATATSLSGGSISATKGVFSDSLQIGGGPYFKNINMADYSGTSTIVGINNVTFPYMRYTKIGPLVLVMYDIGGTSNGTSVSLTVPYTVNLNESVYIYENVATAVDNAATVSDVRLYLTNGSKVINFSKNSGWTASIGTAREIMGTIIYCTTEN